MTQYQVAHVDGFYRVFATETGIDRTYFDHPFKKPRQAIEYANALGGEAPRPAEEGSSGHENPAGRAFPRQPEVPDGTQDASSTPSTCVVCGGPIPPGSYSNRRTCSGACRQAASRASLGDVAKAREAANQANRRAVATGIPGVLTREDVLALWERQPDCVSCGKGKGVDHVTPMSLGGSNTPDNLQTMCRRCNSRKAAAEHLNARGTAEIRRRADGRRRVTPSTPSRPSEAESTGARDIPSPAGPPPGSLSLDL